MEIKQETIRSLREYADERIPPGGFIYAVLTNDLMGAFGKADVQNRLSLFEICSYVYNEMPARCYGSKKIVAEWLAKK